MPAIIPLAIAAIGAGVGIEQAVNTPGSPTIPKTLPTTPLTANQNAQQTAAVGQQLPNLQALTGGSLSPEYAAQFGATQSGTANNPQATGNIQAAINQYFGLTAPGDTGLTSSVTGTSGGGGILDLLRPQTPGGGGSPAPAGNAAIQNWIAQQLQSNEFRGLQA